MVIHFGLLMLSLFFVTACRSWVFKIHGRLFNLPDTFLSRAVYVFLGIYKLMLFFFVVIPWVALKIVLAKG
jgi:hypothetical protein